MMRTSPYIPPVDQLLTHGPTELTAPHLWFNYLQLGFEPAHIPDLISMATDEDLYWTDPDQIAAWAPIHAWRTLAQLRATEAIQPLLTLFDDWADCDWLVAEIPEVLAMIGLAALAPLAAFLADTTLDTDTRTYAVPCIEKLAARVPSAHSDCITVLMNQLALLAENDPEINASLISALMQLRARRAAPLIEQAFAQGCVSNSVMGDWPRVQMALGLQQTPSPSHDLPQTPFSWHTPHTHGRNQNKAAHRKSKKKMAKQSRKINRR